MKSHKNTKSLVMNILALTGVLFLVFHFSTGTTSPVVLGIEAFALSLAAHALTTHSLEPVHQWIEEIRGLIQSIQSDLAALSTRFDDDRVLAQHCPPSYGCIRPFKDFSFARDILKYAKHGDTVYVNIPFLLKPDEWSEEFQVALTRGVAFKFLVLDPDATAMIRARTNQIRKPLIFSVDDYQEGILHFLGNLKAIASKTQGADQSAVEVRFQKTLPCTPKFLILKKSGEPRRAINGYFLDTPSSMGPHVLWEDGDISSPLRSFKQHILNEWNFGYSANL